MDKIALISQNHFLPVPSIYGGACEQLMSIILNENEKFKQANIVYIQKEFDLKTMEKLKEFDFKSTEMVYIKNNKFIDYCIKFINKVLKKLKIKMQISTTYDAKVLKYCKKAGFNKIIFQANLPSNIKKYLTCYKREQLYQQFHTKEPKRDISKYIGNIVGVSQFISNDWKQYFEENNITNMKYYVFQNLIDETKFSKIINEEEREFIRSKYGFSKSDFVVIFVGRVVQLKGIKQLIEAIIDMPKNIKLLVVGSPNFKDKSKSSFLTKIKTYQQDYPDKINFTGFIDNSELYKYYQSADLHVVPSICDEAAGLVVLEGMMSGLPSIITNSGGMPEYVGKGTIIVEKNESIVENLKKSIKKIAEDEKLRQEMIDYNKNHVQKFKKADYYKNFIDIINEKKV